MRVVTWNMNKATFKRRAIWDYMRELNPDIALLQEVNSIPDYFKNHFTCLYRKATNKDNLPQKFGTAILIKGGIIKPVQLESEWIWVNKKLNDFSGNFLAAEIILENGFHARIISVHSPAWRVNLTGAGEIDAGKIKLKNNSDIWGTELLWAGLSKAVSETDLPWIVGGDFNSSTTFDFPKPRGNQEIIDRMKALNLTECLFHSKKTLTPTFKNPRDKKIIHQIDHLFVSKSLISKLQTCETGNPQPIFDNKLSDHLPIISDFMI